MIPNHTLIPVHYPTFFPIRPAYKLTRSIYPQEGGYPLSCKLMELQSDQRDSYDPDCARME